MKQKKRDFSVLLKIIRRFKNFIIQYILIDFGLKFINVMVSFFIMIFIDGIVISSFKFILQFTLLFVIVQLLSITFVFFKTITLKVIENRIVLKLQEYILEKILFTKFRNKEELKGSYLGSRILNDTQGVNCYLIEPIAQLISSFFFLIILVPILLQYDLRIVGVLFASALLPLASVSWINKKIQRSTKKLQENQALYSSSIIDTIDGVREIKLNNIYNKELMLNRHYADSFFNSLLSLSFWGYGSGQISTIIQQVVKSALLMYLGFQIQKQILSLGQAIFIYNISDSLYYVITGFWGLYFSITSSLVSWERIQELIHRESEEFKNKKEIKEIQVIEFYNVTVKKAERAILTEFSLKIKSGDKIAIMGKTGVGKTTILNLLSGLQAYYSGTIFINNIPLEDINLMSMRDKIAYFCQDSHLFSRTIKENIFLQRDYQEWDEQYNHALRISRTDEIDDSKIIEANTRNISGGEKQRIALARCLMKKFDLLLLDEFGSSIDKKMEKAIYKDILNTYQDKTIICVTHKIDIAALFTQQIHLVERDINSEK